nr:TIGR04282 family arsenosugar biosynthesis glycosyltransferase [Costertonia aggregata]
MLSSQPSKNAQAIINYRNITSKNLLLIFTRNPEQGKCKTRLAATVGDETALDIYKFLLEHTVTITQKLDCAKQVWYSEEIWDNDIWDNTVFDKKLQKGDTLGTRMAHAFQEGFAAGYEKIMIIGSDMFDLSQNDFENAFQQLTENDFVLGAAEDGGYYLLGMKIFKAELFKGKDWGTASVLEATLNDLKNETYHILEERNDVDLYEDIKDVEAFLPFLKHIKNDTKTT